MYRQARHLIHWIYRSKCRVLKYWQGEELRFWQHRHTTLISNEYDTFIRDSNSRTTIPLSSGTYLKKNSLSHGIKLYGGVLFSVNLACPKRPGPVDQRTFPYYIIRISILSLPALNFTYLKQCICLSSLKVIKLFKQKSLQHCLVSKI